MSVGLAPSSVGCDRRLANREWTPDDHGHPRRRDRLLSRAGSICVETPPKSRAMASRTLWRVHCSTRHGHGGRGDGDTNARGSRQR